MKRRDLIRHIEAHGCFKVREGSRHTVYRNPATKRNASVPRHTEIKDPTAWAICAALGIPRP